MRQDQFEKLIGLEEKLVDVFLDEATPAKWPGAGIEAATMDQQTRGDRYWCKKNAVATLALVGRIQHLCNNVRMAGAGTTPPEEEGEGEPTDHLDAEIKAAEKEAQRLMAQLTSPGGMPARKPAKSHGRPG